MNSSTRSIGISVGIFLALLYLICISSGFILTDPELITLHKQLLALTFPGFTWLTIWSFLWGFFLSFVYGWLGATAYSWIRGGGNASKSTSAIPSQKMKKHAEGSCCK